MAQTYTPGTRVFSTACTTEMIVVRAPEEAVVVTIGGAPVRAAAGDPEVSPADGYDGGSLLGKRYVNQADTIELLCTRAGDGAAAVDGELLVVKDAAPLPASD